MAIHRPFEAMVKKTPVRIQIDPIECGAVCLGIILEYWGSFVSGRKLRELCKTSLTGSSAQSIIDGALALGLKAKAHKVLPLDVKNMKAPAILFFDQCHFVVYEGYFWGKFYINDPALGRYSLSKEIFRKRFSRVVISVSPKEKLPLKSKPKENLGFESKLMMAILGTFSALLFSFFCASLGLQAARGHELLFSPLAMLGGLSVILGLILCANALWFKIIFKGHSLKESQELLQRLSQAPSDFFRNLPFRVFAHSVQNSFFIIGQRKRASINKYFLGAFMALNFVVLGLISPLTSAIFLLALIFCPAWHRKLLTDKMTIKPHLSVAQDLKAMGQAELLVDGLLRDLKVCPDKNLSIQWAFWVWALFLVLFFMWGEAWQAGHLSLSEIFSSELLLFGAIFLLAQRKNPPSDHEFLSLKQELIFTHERSPKSLVEPKDFLAVVISGHVESLLEVLGPGDRRIGHIDDDSDLFEGSLKDNLSLFEDVSDAELIKALELACAVDLFYNRPLGLLTPILAHGKNLSRSEKKRLLLAQALIKKPDILVLEDFLQALDQSIALKILENLKRAKLTTVFTSYRQEELLKASGILFVHEGRVVSDGLQNLLKNPDFKELISHLGVKDAA